MWVDFLNPDTVVDFTTLYPACVGRACLCIWTKGDFEKAPEECTIIPEITEIRFKGDAEINNGIQTGSEEYLVLQPAGIHDLRVSRDDTKILVETNI